MILYESLPDSIEVEGKLYRIITDFREWIKLQDMLKDNSFSKAEKITICKEWILDDRAPMNMETIKALCNFLIVSSNEGQPEKKTSQTEKIQPTFSYSYDASVIYSDFMREYKIDLIDISYMHWWKFKTLLEGLSEESEFKKRIYYRSVDLSSIKDKSEKKRIEKIKKNIALPTDIMTDEDIGSAFW